MRLSRTRKREAGMHADGSHGQGMRGGKGKGRPTISFVALSLLSDKKIGPKSRLNKTHIHHGLLLLLRGPELTLTTRFIFLNPSTI